MNKHEETTRKMSPEEISQLQLACPARGPRWWPMWDKGLKLRVRSRFAAGTCYELMGHPWHVVLVYVAIKAKNL